MEASDEFLFSGLYRRSYFSFASKVRPLNCVCVLFRVFFVVCVVV